MDEQVLKCFFLYTKGCEKELEREAKTHIKQHCKEPTSRHQSIRIGRNFQNGFESHFLPRQKTKSAWFNVRKHYQNL